ncbi:sensor histidine kinase [Albidovulum sediminis]|uniref:histidine kinase n=1 Tax=Albidovulum sediminis TaxID=3066345 RepID=A0ABT2NTF7_9RHOB|nr:cache domain-containing protein [Defluviimonas sediminis]MCT8330785.1 cache domain-containing protein [Defluviimonas sediminis]
MADPGRLGPGRSVRHRLLAIALLPTLVILPLLLGATIIRWSGKFDDLLITKVNSDLTVARQYLERILETTDDRVRALAESVDFATRGKSAEAMETWRRELGLDYLYLLGTGGRVLSISPATGAPAGPSPAFMGTSIEILSNAELAALSPDLAQRARLDLVPTANAVPTDRAAEDRGMVVQTFIPVTLPDGSPGVLGGGLLLNQNLVFIDTINDLVYRAGSLPDGSQGTATLFLDDVRISTNVRLFEGRRALGTRVSAAVRARVLDKGETWLDRAFVVNDWYISAYEPIADRMGNRVGMLYVGFLEAPFAQAKRVTLWLVGLAFLAVTVLTVPVFLRWARSVFQPLEKVTDTMAAVEAGDLGARTGVTGSRNEVVRVAQHLDHLLDQLQVRDRELRRWNEELNARVEATTRKLILSEKLATVGEITAAAAHEINNPVAVIQGNLDVLREVMADRMSEVATEFSLMDEQVHRISSIVNRLLQFARPEEYAGWTTRLHPMEAVADCLPLVRHLLKQARVTLELGGKTSRQVTMNRTEFQQVIINLIANATHAMPDGGCITVTAEDVDQSDVPGVRLSVRDTGVGMDEDTISRIFDPFFTTRGPNGGTGLGLSICRTLVDRQGGTIDVESAPGHGSAFVIWLPEAV